MTCVIIKHIFNYTLVLEALVQANKHAKILFCLGKSTGN